MRSCGRTWSTATGAVTSTARAKWPVFLAGFLAGPGGLRDLAGEAEVYSDKRPFLECATRGPSEKHSGEIAVAGALREQLEMVEGVIGSAAAPREAELAAEVREKNLADIEAAAWVRRAEAAEGRESYEQVAELLSFAVAANPENAGAQRLLGDALLSSGKLGEAKAAYERAYGIRPEDARVFRGLGVVHHRRGRLAEAIGFYRKFLKARPLDGETHNNLGAALAADDRLGEALLHFETALELQPENVDAQRNAARARAAMGLE